jgi:hypothetical protein
MMDKSMFDPADPGSGNKLNISDQSPHLIVEAQESIPIVAGRYDTNLTMGLSPYL